MLETNQYGFARRTNLNEVVRFDETEARTETDDVQAKRQEQVEVCGVTEGRKHDGVVLWAGASFHCA